MSVDLYPVQPTHFQWETRFTPHWKAMISPHVCNRGQTIGWGRDCFLFWGSLWDKDTPTHGRHKNSFYRQPFTHSKVLSQSLLSRVQHFSVFTPCVKIAPCLSPKPVGTSTRHLLPVVRLPNPFSVDKVFLTIVSLVCPNPFRAENILQWSCRPFRLLVLHSWHFILSQAPLKISLTPLEAEISAQLLFNMAAACLVKAL